MPAATIAASVAWSSGAPGVVTWASWRSRASPTFVSTVPIRPVDTPAASSAATARNEVVVLPSVPVIPTTPSRRDGSPVPPAGGVGERGPGAGHDDLRQRRPGHGPLDDRRGGAGLGRGPTYSVPSTWKPGTATNSVPSSDLARVLDHAPDRHVAHPADADRQVVAPRAAQEAGGVEPGEQPGRAAAGSVGSAAAMAAATGVSRIVVRSLIARSAPARHEAFHPRQPAAQRRSATAAATRSCAPASATHSAPNDRLCSYRP